MSNLMMMRFGDAGSLAFPDFDKILDFTSTGSEASTSVVVNSDVDLEYKVIIRSLDTTNYTRMRFNADTGNNYGRQLLTNSAGSVSAVRDAQGGFYLVPNNGASVCTIIAPVGFIKTAFQENCRWTTGTTVNFYNVQGVSWNNTASITAIGFAPDSGNFTAGTRIIVYKRRVNT